MKRQEATIDKPDHTGAFHLGKEIDLNRATELKEALLLALAHNDRLTIHLDSAVHPDFLLVQFLCAVHRTAANLGKSLQLGATMSPQALQALQRMGVGGRHGCAAAGACPCLWDVPRP